MSIGRLCFSLSVALAPLTYPPLILTSLPVYPP